ncbi:hypothetical protein KCU77_g984, partial [Aureobasidium melanogenum]
MISSQRVSRSAFRSHPYPRYHSPNEAAMHWRKYRNGPGKGMALLKVAIIGSLTYLVAKKIFQDPKSSTNEQN